MVFLISLLGSDYFSLKSTNLLQSLLFFLLVELNDPFYVFYCFSDLSYSMYMNAR
ncbi:hypothetical protein JHK82_040719 [Glycine max]|uniref:Uncharacterized protein n=2 Tax=Glycine subgen. Soja TaxID=1462606 RepID=K7M8E8_SOYBN|nr:hypothetical protein JHK86_040921 [Glycine max]RZB70122.1 hypothetical protein D0Y65_039424 [Glycine soja]KAG4966556.1 hypothetical protein JHK85_041531 [Glycine max]KAG5111496.1 hypothetical protein JHK82_040719 [Glycine max]KAG5122790.1 hypothetical protein JHK84_041130 [Glycine max]